MKVQSSSANRKQTTISGNLFGGLSRHVHNNNNNQTTSIMPVNLSQTPTSGKSNSVASPVSPKGIGSYHHQRGHGSTGYLLSEKQQYAQQQPNSATMTQQQQWQSAQHNSNYQTMPTSPNIFSPITASEQQTQYISTTSVKQKSFKRKSESLQQLSNGAQKEQQASLPYRQVLSYVPAKMTTKEYSFGKSQQANQLLSTQLLNSNKRKQEQLQARYDAPESFQNSSELLDVCDPQTNITKHMSFNSEQQKMHPQPVPHAQFLSPASGEVESRIMYNGQENFSDEASRRVNEQKVKKQNYMNVDSIQATGSFKREVENQDDTNESSQEAVVHMTRATELISPDLTPIHMGDGSFKHANNHHNLLLHTSDNICSPISDSNMTPFKVTKQGVDAQVGATLCCTHEQTKQYALLTQKVQFMTEQIDEEKRQAKMKEQQYNKIIAALKKTAEENNFKQNKYNNEQQATATIGNNPGSKDWKETINELNVKKDEVNGLQERVLELELKAEKVALDHKIKVQAKDDDISEEKLRFKHKESDLRQAMAQIERLNEDLQEKIQESLDRQSERLGNEKQMDMDAMNRRNEQLIKQLVESHSSETRRLRDLLLQQERKCRESEHQAGNLEIELRTVQLNDVNRFDSSELEEMQMQSVQVNELRLQAVKAQFTEENQQLRDVIVQLETHINQLQDSRSESDRKLIISEDKIAEFKKSVAQNKILIAFQKEKEEKLQQTHKAQIAKERKTADTAVSKVKAVHKLESEVNKKQILINQLKAKILEMEGEEQHKSKVLLMKRRQIEDEKTVLIKKQALRQRSMHKDNLSATRLKQQLDTKQAVIQTERDSKKALIQEKSKLERQISIIKREKVGRDADQSSRQNESMSMYFTKSQGLFSPRNAVRDASNGSKQNKTFVSRDTKPSGQMTQRYNALMSQSQMGYKELYQSKQYSNDRTSSMGGGSLQGGDSMVNIVEFEDNISPKSRGRFQENNSIILTTPFRQDEPNDTKINLQHFKTHKPPQLTHSQSVIETNFQTKNNLQSKIQQKSNRNNDNNADKQINKDQFLTHSGEIAHFSAESGKKFGLIKNKVHKSSKDNTAEEAEFIQVLSGCDTSNESQGEIRKMQSLKQFERAPGMWMSRKANQQKQSTTTVTNPNSATNNLQELRLSQPEKDELIIKNTESTSTNNNQTKKKGTTPSLKELTRPSHLKTKSMNVPTPIKTYGKAEYTPTRTVSSSKANMLVEQRANEEKETFVKTVLTARQKCETFNTQVRQNEQDVLTSRDKAIDVGSSEVQAHLQAEGETVSVAAGRVQFSKENNQSNFTTGASRYGPQTHANIRQLNRNKGSTVGTSKPDKTTNRSPISRTPLDHVINGRQMVTTNDESCQKKPLLTDATPKVGGELAILQLNENRSAEKMNSFNVAAFQLQMTNNSVEETYSQPSSSLVFQNNMLKEQLELVKKSLAVQQQKASVTELTMMDAIMQMKEQIQQVMVVQKSPKNANNAQNIEENSKLLKTTPRQKPYQQQHEEYRMMQRMSRNELDTNNEAAQSAVKHRKVRNKITSEISNNPNTAQDAIRKTNSVNHSRQRSETFDMSQAESMYKQIKMKSPSKKANLQHHSSVKLSTMQQPQAQQVMNSGNFQKATTSSNMKRNNATQQQQLMTSQSNKKLNSHNSGIYQPQFNQASQSTQALLNVSEHQSLQQRLSIGVLRHGQTAMVAKKVSHGLAVKQKTEKQEMQQK